MPDALYDFDGDLYYPGELTRGPWSPDAQHGGPVAALLARAAEQLPSEVPVQVVRLTVELVRPVPLSPLALSVSLARPGRRVQLVDASITAGGLEVAKARALRIRTASVPVPEQLGDPPSPALPDGDSPAARIARTAFAEAVELRFVRGSWEQPGPVTMWSRLLVPVVAGEDPSPLQRTAAAADFGNGVSRVLDFETHTFINPDLTVALARCPVGEWVGFDAVSRISRQGWGQAESLIFDPAGPVGRSVQSLLVEALPPRA